MELKLIAYRTDTGFKQEVALGSTDLKIGRSPECQITLPCDQKIVSRVHAIVRHLNGRYLLEDAGSANGVFLVSRGANLTPQQQHPLQPGEEFRIGPFQLRVNHTAAKTTQSSGAGTNAEPAIKQPRAPRPTPTPTPAADQSSAPDSSIFTASGNDYFTPPAALIPENWNLQDESTSPAATAANSGEGQQRRAEVLSFNQQQHKLVASLLKGMRVGDQLQAADINAEQLEVIGQTLRVLADTTLKALHNQRDVKSRLCLDAPAVARELAKDPLCEIRDGDALLAILLDNRHSNRQALPSMLLHSTEAMVEDLLALEQQTLEAINIATNQLAPEQIEQAYAQQPLPEGSLQQANLKFRQTLSPGALKWSFYEQFWPKASDRIRDDIHKSFEKRILQLTARRAKR